jgi:hypothetical protein
MFLDISPGDLDVILKHRPFVRRKSRKIVAALRALPGFFLYDDHVKSWTEIESVRKELAQKKE